MSFGSEAAKLITNKYFLYFMVFLAITNVIGYLATNKLNAVIFFILICILAYNFSKNMAVVLIVAIVATNLLMVNKSMREGFTEGMDGEDTDTTTDPATTTTTTTDTATTDAVKQKLADAKTAAKAKLTPEQQATIDAGKTNMAAAKTTAQTNVAAKETTISAKKAEMSTEPMPEEEGFAPAGSGFNGKKRGAIGGPAKASRIDYSTTLEQAYDNLDKMLESDGLNNLSADTNKLMSQQQKLFGTVDKLMPMIDKAQNMISGLDIDKINNLIGMTEKFGNLGGGIGSLIGSKTTNQAKAK
jgi:hypothetical protein